MLKESEYNVENKDEIQKGTSMDNLAKEFPEEFEGWHGYIEWEKYPERQAKAHEILQKKSDNGEFVGHPEFQFVPLPNTNPVLPGTRFRQYYDALGPTLAHRPDESWEIVKKEKHAQMLHVLEFPYNGEAPHNLLMDGGAITPNSLHFVRNHGDIPVIEVDKYFLEVGGLVNTARKFTLNELKDETKFKQRTVTITLQCAGTRRLEQIHEYPGEGDELINAPWGEGAISNAIYRGVSLKKVLQYCGIKKGEAKHVEFIGADTYFKKNQVYNYAVSVPYRKVKSNEVFLVWEMNGEPLPLIHGFPLRVVVTGYIGARSCKWLTRINVLPEPSWGPVQRQEYLYFNTQVGKHNLLFSSGFSIQDMPVASAILSPSDKQVVVHSGRITVAGWAYSGGGRWIERVEVSPDYGYSWYQVDPDNMTQKHYHAWRLWKIELPVNTEGWIDLCCRAWDSACNTQPTTVRDAWNWDLHVTHSCHRMKIFSVNCQNPLTAKRLQEFKDRKLPFEPITNPIPFVIENLQDYKEAIKKNMREPID